MTTAPDAPAPPTPFSSWLKSYGAGSLDDKLTAAIAEAAQAVVLFDKSGKITLTLSLAAKGDGVIVTPDIKVAKPESKPSGQFFYVARDGALSRRDPNQPVLPGMADQTET